METDDVFFHADGSNQQKLKEAVEALDEKLFQSGKSFIHPSHLEAKMVYDTTGEPAGDERVYVYPQKNLTAEVTNIKIPKGAKKPHLIPTGLAFTLNKTNYLLSRDYQEPK